MILAASSSFSNKYSNGAYVVITEAVAETDNGHQQDRLGIRFDFEINGTFSLIHGPPDRTLLHITQ